MNEIDVVRDISRKFEQAGIPYLSTGSEAAYLDQWAPGLGVTDLLEECRHD
jgi:hypothetical protein